MHPTNLTEVYMVFLFLLIQGIAFASTSLWGGQQVLTVSNSALTKLATQSTLTYVPDARLPFIHPSNLRHFDREAHRPLTNLTLDVVGTPNARVMSLSLGLWEVGRRDA